MFFALKTFDDDRQTQFSTYARSCIDNRLASMLRQAARQKNVPLNEFLPLEDGDWDTGDPGPTPEELAIASEGYAALTEKVRQLLSRYEQDVLRLILEGYDYKSAAVQLGTTAKSVDNALQRARNKLKIER